MWLTKLRLKGEDRMRSTIVLAVAALMASTSLANSHGGGCRKSSPPGQCCHADNSQGGRVHCH